MVLIRAAYTKIFPELDRILSIDMDTIVNENVSDLWDLDLTDYYIAAVEECELTKEEGSYFNMGVAMLNLKKIREDKKDDEIIDAINTYWYRYKEQDCFNEFFRGHALILPSDYNCCWQAEPPKHEKITHFAGLYKLDKFPHFNYYKNLSNDFPRNIQDNITLDIIIPTYKNKKGLRRTLNSIPSNPNVNVIVVDDCSNLDYSDILEEYPSLHFYQLEENSGPGMAR
jgi:lipopolysaccharide biosynthesis glycosyltransferase